ncbi:MAG: hypothetical protein EOP37_12100 [Rubrivivax sp.]|nr:MAG: hypothetical protein EOP37_12100 [Rubrivivax sp.]
MDFVSFAGALKDLFSALSGFGLTAGGTAIVAVCALLYSRTSSAHPVLALLWMRFFGKLTIDDAKVQKYVDELNSLSRFTFFTRIRSQTLRDAHGVLDWCQQWNVAPSLVRACGDNFDLTLPGLRNGKGPKGWSLVFLFLIFTLMTTAGIGSAALMVPDAALVTFNDSGNSLWLSETSALRFPVRGKKRLEQHDCKEPGGELSQRTGFAEGEVEILCSFFSGKDKSPAEYVERNVQQNRTALGVVGAMSLVFAFVIWGEVRRNVAASQLEKHLLRHAERVKGPLTEGDKAEPDAPSVGVLAMDAKLLARQD